MKPIEEKQQIFKVKIDDNGDFKVVKKKIKTPITIILDDSNKSPNKRTSTDRNAKKTEKKLVSRSDTRESKRENDAIRQKIRKNVAIQRIMAYVQIVSPDDQIVDEKGFYIFIKNQMRKKYPDKYLDIIKKRGIMVPCGEGKLRFTRRIKK